MKCVFSLSQGMVVVNTAQFCSTLTVVLGLARCEIG